MTWLAYSHLGVARTVQLTTQPAGALAGIAFSVQPVGRLVDGSGVLSRATGVTVTASKASGTGTLSGTLSVQTVEGVFTFTDLKMDTVTSAVTLTFASSGLTSAVSNAFNVTQPNTTLTAESGSYVLTGSAASFARTRVCACSPGAYDVTGTVTTLLGPATYDYYIGPSGSDSNAGTFGSPWAITALGTKTATIAGKTVGLLDGTYTVAVTTSGGNNTGGIQVSAAGVTIRAVNDRLAILTTNSGGSYPQDTDPMFQSLGDGITWDGLAFYQSSFDFLRITGDSTTITNCSFEDVNLGRIAGQPTGDNVGAIFIANSAYPANLLIQNCRFENIYNAAATENGNAIGPLYYAGSTVVEKCSFFDCDVGVGWKSYNNGPLTVRQCYFDSTVGKLAVYGGMSNDYVVPMVFTFTNNVVNRCGYALDGWNINTADSEVASTISRNTFVLQSAGYGVSGIAYSNGLTGAVLSGANLHLCTLQDNVLYLLSGSDPLLYFGNSRNPSTDLFGQIDYNMYSTVAMRDANGTTYTTIANWRTRLAASGVTGREANSFVGSPTFVNSAGNTAASYALASGSGKNAASDGTDMGAWGGGISQIGCDFT